MIGLINVEQLVGMRIGSGNGSTRGDPAPVPLCLPQIPHRRGKPATMAIRMTSNSGLVLTLPGCRYG
jgi:hypothetical protein